MSHNRNGELTLVPMPGFEGMADELKRLIESKEDSQKTMVNIAAIKLGERPSEEPYCRKDEEFINGHDCVIITSGPGIYRMLVQLLIVLRHLTEHNASRIGVVAGYFPLSRTEKNEHDKTGSIVEFALTTLVQDLMVAAAMNAFRQPKLSRIISVDLHAPNIANTGCVSEVSLVRILIHQVFEDVGRIHPNKKFCVMLPDDGASKRYAKVIEQVANDMGVKLPIVCGNKRRWGDTVSELVGLYGDTDALPNSVVIILDDEIATGGTLIQTAGKLMEAYKAHICWAVAPHGLLCGRAPQLLAAPNCPIEHVYVSTTLGELLRRPELVALGERFHLIPWTKTLAQILFYYHWGKDIHKVR